MKNFRHYICAIIFALLTLGANAASDSYDTLAKEITQGCNNNYERALAIYRWICANISYDLEGEANSADKCLKLRRGTSFGYSQLYARLAQQVGMQPIVVAGKAKGGPILKGHCWVYVKCDEKDVLIDPMWGSGSIKDGQFIRSENDESWFDVKPEWMIFTHFPQEKKYQFIKKKINEEKFKELPVLYPYIEKYGFDAATVLKTVREKESGAPEIFDLTDWLDAEFTEAPIQEELRVGQEYCFTVKKRSAHKLLLICGSEYVTEDMWQCSDSIYTLSYRPFKADKLSLSFEHNNDGIYTTAIEYKIAPPTNAEIDTLEKYRPLAGEEIRKMTNANIEVLERMKLDGHKLLKGIRAKEITSMPQFYADCKFDIIDIPLTGTLKKGENYRFRIRPHEKGHSWIIKQGHKRFRRWSIDQQSGEQEITVRPTETGTLELTVIYSNEQGVYRTCILYTVQ